MDVVRELADRIIVLHNGQLVADGEPAEVIASPIVQKAYLGRRAEEAACAGPHRSLPTAKALRERRCSSSTACTRTSARTTSCTASTSRCRPAR